MVNTVCRNGGHGLQERWTRPSGTVDTVARNGGHGVLERWTRAGVGWGTGWVD
ncbi:hypothetical protein [Kibdelosporangium philippinense]|uniref:hypothetical protein n=1 Tax=Kibdelosporangium philippinense TaxID=211113 RepID=UPI0036116D01